MKPAPDAELTAVVMRLIDVVTALQQTQERTAAAALIAHQSQQAYVETLDAYARELDARIRLLETRGQLTAVH